jgi:hypothetical protein
MALATFNGGPYDGLEPIDWHEYRLGTEVEVPISADLLRLLSGEKPGPPTSLSGVAVYRFEVTRLGVRFHFLKRRAVKPAERRLLETWHSHVVQRLQEQAR